MEPVKTGEKLVCAECGVELEVVKGCGCGDCRIECCGKPMERRKGEGGGCCCG
jgi:hypothetical protein